MYIYALFLDLDGVSFGFANALGLRNDPDDRTNVTGLNLVSDQWELESFCCMSSRYRYVFTTRVRVPGVIKHTCYFPIPLYPIIRSPSNFHSNGTDVFSLIRKVSAKYLRPLKSYCYR